MTSLQRRSAPAARSRAARTVRMYAVAPLCEWAVWIAVLVEAYDTGGASTSGRVAVALLVPPMVVTPLAARAAGGRHPLGALQVVFAAQAAALVAATISIALGAPLVLTTAATAVALCGVPFVRPCVQVALPGLVTTTAELLAANARLSTADGAASLLGPLGAAALLAVGGPAGVFAGAAACMVLAVGLAAAPARALRPSEPDAPDAPPDGEAVRHATRALARRTSPALLLAVAAPSVLLGALDLLGVNLSLGALGLGASGAGWLGVAFGVGAVVGGLSSRRLVGRPLLARPIVGALVMIGAAGLALVLRTDVGVAVAVFAVVGAGRTAIDVCSRTLLQRAAAEDDLGVTFALVELCSAVGILTGSLLTQVLLAVGGTDAALTGVAVTFVATAFAVRRGLRRADAVAEVPHVELRLLRRTPLFASLPAAALEQLARTATHDVFGAGATVVRQDEPGDRYFVIVAGTVDVFVDGAHVRTMSSGAGFGEIALLADLPRTATVVAREPLALLSIARSSFLTAVLGHEAAHAAAWQIARRLHPPLGPPDRTAEDA